MDKFVALVVVLIPILGNYTSPLPGVDIGTFFVIILLMLNVIKKGNIIINRNNMIFLIVYLLFSPLLWIISNEYMNNLYIYPSYSLLLSRLGKIILNLFVMFMIINIHNIDKELVIKQMKFVVYINTLYIIVQRIAYLFHIYIPNIFGNLALSESYKLENYNMVSGGILFRPSGFFLEPSHFAQYSIVFLCYAIFFNDKKHSSIINKDALICIVGIVFSSSGMGILCVAIILGIAFIRKKETIIRKVVESVVLFISIFVFTRLDFAKNIMDRIFSDGSKYGGNAIEARIGQGYEMVLSKNFFFIFFGNGFGYVPNGEYLNGIAYCLNTIGIVGIIVFVYILIKYYMKGELWIKITLICYTILLSAAQLFSASELVFIFSLTELFSDKKIEINNLQTIRVNNND